MDHIKREKELFIAYRTMLVYLFGLIALVSSSEAYVPQLDGRIVGGEDTTIEEFPYQLSLLKYNFHSCGASIISENWALTAAHCVQGSSPSAVKLRSESSVRNQGGIIHDVSEIIVHEKFSRADLDYDFAVLKVSQPFSLNEKAQTIKLGKREAVDGDSAIVTGWGTLSSGGILPSQLQKVTVPIVDRELCKELYKLYTITERMVCAGLVEEGGKDACQGDSGGPLVVNGELVGVVSWGLGCAFPKYPGIYSNVASAWDWVHEKANL